MAKEEAKSPHVYAAIAAVAGEMAKIGISKDRTAQGYKFRGIDDVYNALAPLLAEHNLVIIPRCLERICVERQTKSGNAMFYVTVKSEFDFVSALDGSKHTACTYGEAMDTSDKATNTAMSAAYKYAAFQAFCIPIVATDSEVDNHEPAPTPPKPKTNLTAEDEVVARNIFKMIRGATTKNGIDKIVSGVGDALAKIKAQDESVYDKIMAEVIRQTEIVTKEGE